MCSVKDKVAGRRAPSSLIGFPVWNKNRKMEDTPMEGRRKNWGFYFCIPDRTGGELVAVSVCSGRNVWNPPFAINSMQVIKIIDSFAFGGAAEDANPVLDITIG